MFHQPKSTWNAGAAVELLCTYGQAIRQSKKSVQQGGLRNLKLLASQFYDQCHKPEYTTSLTSSQQLNLINHFVNLAGWLDLNKLRAPYSLPKTAITIKIILLQLAKYIVVKTSSFRNPSEWHCNALKLALETATCCFDAKDWTSLVWCLNEAHSHLPRDPCQWPVQFRAPVTLCGNLLTVLQCLHSCCSHPPDGMVVAQVSNLSTIEISPQQSLMVAHVCFNTGLDFHSRSDFESAVPWLKLAHRFGKTARTSQRNDIPLLESKALDLLAVTLFKLDAVKHSEEIVRLLDLADQTVDNVELRFRTLLAAKGQLVSSLVRTIELLFGFYLKDDKDNCRINILRVFDALEATGHHQVCAVLLNRILCKSDLELDRDRLSSHIAAHSMDQIRWTFAEVVCRSCLKRDSLDDCYKLLSDMVHWRPAKGNREALNFVLHTALTLAMQTPPCHKRLRSFPLLIAINRRHGEMDIGLAKLAIRSLLRCGEEAIAVADGLLDDVGAHGSDDLQYLHLNLLTAILRRDREKALRVCLMLEASYKANPLLDPATWGEALETLEECLTASLASNMEEVALHCLAALMKEKDRRPAQTIWLVRLTKFHLKVILRLAVGNSVIGTKCIENLITILISALLLLQDSLSSLDELECGVELWFGDLAWFLGGQVEHTSSFHRHQLYKLAYKLLCLTPILDEEIKRRIDASIVLSVSAGIESEADDNLLHRKILKKCLEAIGDYSGENLRYAPLLHFFEFYILCELGDLKRLAEALDRFKADNRVSNVASFFVGLADLASSNHRVFLRHILPSVRLREGHCRQTAHQVKLTNVAVACLKIALRIQTDTSSVSDGDYPISAIWQKLVVFTSENIFLQDDLMSKHLRVCHEYSLFIGNNRDHVEPAEVAVFFNHTWNTFVDVKMYRGTRAAELWKDVVERIASSSPSLEKMRSSLFNKLEAYRFKL